MIRRTSKAISYDEALRRMESICAKGERCSYEITQKLIKLQLSGADIKKIIERLTETKFLDDQRFAFSFANDKYKFNRWGKIKIAIELRKRKIQDSFINSSIESIDEDDYFSRLTSLLIAKAPSIKEGNTFEGRTKLYRFAIQRGYESNIVARIIKSGAPWDTDSSH